MATFFFVVLGILKVSCSCFVDESALLAPLLLLTGLLDGTVVGGGGGGGAAVLVGSLSAFLLLPLPLLPSGMMMISAA